MIEYGYQIAVIWSDGTVTVLHNVVGITAGEGTIRSINVKTGEALPIIPIDHTSAIVITAEKSLNPKAIE